VSFTAANLPDAGHHQAVAYRAIVSFDLAVWDAVRPPRVAEARERYEQIRAGTDTVTMPSPRITAFVEECEQRQLGGAGDDPIRFTSQRLPSALLLQIRAEVATELYGEVAAMAERHGLVLYDEQSGVISIPSRLSFDAQPPVMRRGWFGGRRG